MLVVALLLSLTTAGAAEPEQKPEQKKQPIYIESDSLNIDDAKGISTYTGNVVFRQGADTLHADELVIYSEQRKELKRVVAKGKPARFDHVDELPSQTSWGEAGEIEYLADKSLLILNGDARFQQGDNQFSGNHIEYDSERKLVKAGSNGGNGAGRVQIVIHPDKGDAETQDTPPASGSPPQ
jgi:lipopolysaccharide export system protein LptA